MDNRRWARVIARGIVCTLLLLGALTGVARADARDQDFDNNWKFALVNPADITDPTGAYADAMSPSFDDSSWRTVQLPHDWSIELDPTTSGTSGGTGYLQGGLGWYRKTFTLPAADAGKDVSVEFDGVYMDSYVYLNGVLVGNHPYGYTHANYDLSGAKAADGTPLLHTDGTTPNVIAVKVQNKQPSSRWYSGSGIYRNVHLVVTDPIHVARYGTFVTTPDVENTYTSGGYANVHVATTVQNDSGASQPVGILNRVTDADGNVVGTSQSSQTVGADKVTDAVDIRVDHPHLWSPDSPYLYTLHTDLMMGGDVIDSTTTRFGVRWFKIDPDQGLTINGKYTKMQGVDLHHDQGALGTAINKDALMRQMKIMRSMGVNAFRTSHNPPSPEMIQVCDELGIVMMVEAFDSWRRGKVAFDYGRFFDANHDSDIQDMVLAARNDPAVMMWSIGNEIPDSTSAAGLPMADDLVRDIRAVDDTRPIVIGSDKYRSVPSTGSATEKILVGDPSQDPPYPGLDGLGLNYNTAKSVDALHAKYPTKFLFESESSSETSTRGVYQDPDWLNTGENYTPGKLATSSYDNNLASWTMSGEYGLKKDRDRRYFLGEFLWSGFDYIGEPTPYGQFPVKSSFFGAVDTAGFPKDMYWLFRSQWTKDPMVHVLPMNWTDYKPGQNVQVWAYANVDTVELFLNGRSLGVRHFDHKTTTDGREYLETTECTGDDKTFSATDNPTCPGSYTSPNGSSGKLHLTWNVPFEPGKLVAVATKDGQEVARDEVDTAGAPDTVKVTPDKSEIAADGKSLSYLTVDVVDKDGVMVPDADNELSFDVKGGKLVGLDNGREESAENYKSHQRAAFNGKALAIIQSSTDSGPITVTVTSPGLLPQTVTVFAGGGGVEPVYARGAVGSAPVLPSTVRKVADDGSVTTVPVTWNAPAALSAGLNTITGSGGATALVTGYTVDHVAGYSVVVPSGTSPTLPGTADVVYSDGTDRQLPVTWDAIPAGKLAGFGRFTVDGTIAGVAQKAVATITVSDLVSDGQNLARSTSRAKPSADAGYSGARTTIPAAMLDGTTTTGGWSSAYNKSATALLPAVSKAHDSEWVSVKWPSAQTFGEIRPYFTVSSTRAFPSAFAVTYWDGSAFVPVKNLTVTQAADSNQPSTLSFDPVNTDQVRIEMTTPPDKAGTNTGFFQITELEVNGKLVQPTILDLEVNGVPVPGFDPAVSSYGPIPVQYDQPITVTGTPASDETVSFTPPASLPGDGIVTVTSGDGSATTTYTLHLIPADIVSGPVGGTVPATLSLTLGAPATFGTFTPGVDGTYTAATTANVISTAGDAALSVSDPDTAHPGHLVNGTFALPQALQAKATSPVGVGSAFAPISASPATLLSYAGPVSNDPVAITFQQSIARTDALRTGSYGKTLTFTLSTTNP